MAFPQKIVFAHLPKTAGTSVVRLLEENYTLEQRLPYYETNRLSADHKIFTDTKPCVLYGHIYFSKAWLQANPEVYTFTFLRDPLQRTLSHYLFVKNSKNNTNHKTWFKEWGNFAGYLKSKQSLNFQTRMLSGIIDFDTFAADLPAAYEKALKNMKSLSAVGLSEYFGESIAQIGTDLGWQKVWEPTANRGKRKAQSWWLAKKYKAAIAERTYYDQKLYEVAKELLFKRTKEV
jgi:hypothetical protein